MAALNFADRLSERIRSNNSRVVVGLDPNPAKFPVELKQAWDQASDGAARAEVVREFCDTVIRASQSVACAFKPQIAFFEQFGSAGIAVLEELLRANPDSIFIMDCKRGDIGSTVEAYAKAYFELPGEPAAPMSCAAVTHNPYLGLDSVLPYFPYLAEDRGMFILCKTSNPSALDFQDRLVDDRSLYLIVAEQIELWGEQFIGECGFSSLGLVAGATHPYDGEAIRNAAPHALFLVPGIGTQGGKVDDVRAFTDENGNGAVFNFSRSVIYPQLHGPFAEDQGGSGDFASMVKQAADFYREALNSSLGF
ncbi:orotidine-5'-phosphate decarboxylase [bacterium]|nr:orotidine-5'-phosphate decarboxylase [bacterium]